MGSIKSAVVGSFAIGAAFSAQPGSAAQSAVSYPIYTGISAGTPIGPINTLWGVGTLAIGADGNYYGTNGVVSSETTVTSLFEVTPAGTYSSLYTLSGNDGANPTSLLAAGNGALYGSNRTGGASDFGTLFKYSGGHYTLLHTFSGLGPDGGEGECLNKGADGAMYGVTSVGNANGGYGTIFRLGTDGSFQTIYTFAKGAEEAGCPLVAADGTLYGAATLSVTGTSTTTQTFTTGIYRLTPDGTFSVLQQFSYTANNWTRRASGTSVDNWGSLAFGSDGNLYGTELQYSNTVEPTGKLYQLTTSGSFKVVANSILVGSRLIAAADGSIYSYQAGFNILYRYSPKTFLPTSFQQSVLSSMGNSVWANLSPAQPASWFVDGYDSMAVAPDADGNLIVASQDSTTTSAIDKIVVAGDMTATATVVPAKILAGKSATISWNFTGGSDCAMVGDAPDVASIGSQPAKGSLKVTPSTTNYLYRFALQCHDSQQGIVRVPLLLRVNP